MLEKQLFLVRYQTICSIVHRFYFAAWCFLQKYKNFHHEDWLYWFIRIYLVLGISWFFIILFLRSHFSWIFQLFSVRWIFIFIFIRFCYWEGLFVVSLEMIFFWLVIKRSRFIRTFLVRFGFFKIFFFGLKFIHLFILVVFLSFKAIWEVIIFFVKIFLIFQCRYQVS